MLVCPFAISLKLTLLSQNELASASLSSPAGRLTTYFFPVPKAFALTTTCPDLGSAPVILQLQSAMEAASNLLGTSRRLNCLPAAFTSYTNVSFLRIVNVQGPSS